MTEKNIYIQRLELEHAQDLLDLRLKNKDFLKPFEPEKPEYFFTLSIQTKAIMSRIIEWEEETAFGFGIFLSENDQLIGTVTLSNVVYAAWQNCTIGYFLDKEFNGKGFATQAVRLAVKFAFENANLHRVQAAIMPRNIASIKVIEKNGFRYEGLSTNYIEINGKWEDHKIYAITKENYYK